MKKTILYYPTINIPNNSWLRNSLLYWDEISSIVPKSWDEKILVKLSDDIKYLLDEKEFRPIKPEDLITKTDNWMLSEQFATEFLEIASSESFKNFIDIQNHLLKYTNKKTEYQYLKIHNNKVSGNLQYKLEELGLAYIDKSYEWIFFEKHTAYLYMSILAKYLAEIDSEYITISTDTKIYENFNFKQSIFENKLPVISCNFHNLLPTPNLSVPIKEIIKFKKKRKDNLEHFRKLITNFESKLSKAKTNQEIKEATILFQDEIKTGVSDLTSVLADSRIKHTFKSLKSLISIKSGPVVLLLVRLLKQ
ncbi:DUF6236 family protein [Chryseobacterium sp. R2ACT005]|uniref:DUF6236 family protein n=1 Tax=Chryseobacterium sp. R2ACT005 TaxID=3416668 RepID=UPI003CE7ED0B